MNLEVHVLGRRVARLEAAGDFRSILTYEAGVAAEDFVSLTMPVREEAWEWDDPLHPVFRMNLPEGYLLHVLEERFGPHIGASPAALLAVVGRNMVGRLQVAPPGANLSEPVRPLDVKGLLQGDNSEKAFSQLVSEYATSGVSGVVPKFLDAEKSRVRLSQYGQATLLSRRHIIKGSTRQLPYISLNEHFGMQVAGKVLPAARTEISQDGQALVVHRFDTDEGGQPCRGLEDFCVLLGLRPAAKYETTWERIAKAVRDHVPIERRRQGFRQLAGTILLTYALRNADCHAKNVALLYTSREDAQVAPVFDMLTTCVYPGYQDSPPGIAFMGKKTWLPGKNLEKFLVSIFGVEQRDQAQMVEQISDAIAEVAPLVRQSMKEHPGFRDLGKRMLAAWKEGVSALRGKTMYGLPGWKAGEAFQGFSDPPKLKTPRKIIGKD